MISNGRSLGIPTAFSLSVLLLLVCSVLSACGGSSGSGDTGDPDLTPQAGDMLVYGTAAAGAPVVGYIYVRGASGATSAPQPIAQDGRYEVNVDDLRPPYLVWAKGAANGVPVELYSLVSEPGRVNITPITHAILAMAVGASPEIYFASTDPQAGLADAVAQAKADMSGILGDLLSDLEDVDLMTGDFSPNGQGMDLLLEALAFQIVNGQLELVNQLTGNILFTHALSNGVPAGGLDSTAISAIFDSQLQLKKMREIFQTEVTAYADPSNPPTLSLLQDQIGSLMADGFLNSGYNAEQELAAWVDETSARGPASGMALLGFAVHRPMQMHHYKLDDQMMALSESGDYDAGAWVVVTLGLDGRTETMLTGLVRNNGGAWLWYGNRKPFTGRCVAKAIGDWQNDVQGQDAQATGLEFTIDDEGNWAANNFGVAAALIYHSALPYGGELGLLEDMPYFLLMIPSYDPQVSEYAMIYPFEGGKQYLIADGLDISAVADPEFLFVGYDPAELSVKGIWIELLEMDDASKVDPSDIEVADQRPVIPRSIF